MNDQQLSGPDRDAVEIGVRELRGDLAGVLRRAGNGTRVVVTAHGRPLAQLGPLDEHAPDLDRLVASGALVAPRRTGGWRPPDAVPVYAGVRIDQALRELRG